MEKKKSNRSLLRVTFRAMARRLGTSILLAAVVFAGCFTAVLLDRLLQRQEESLQQMIETTRIRCVVTDARGMHSDDLDMFSGFVDMLMGLRRDRGCYLDEYVMDVNAISTSPLDRPEDTRLCRILSFASDKRLSALEGNTVELDASWTEACLAGRDKVCIITEDIPTYTDEGGVQWVQIAQGRGQSGELRVIGKIQGNLKKTIYCPFYLSWQETVSESYRVESCSFTIRDNTRLEESKDAIYASFVEPSLSNTLSDTTYGVVVQDETYLKALKEIQSNLAMLRLLPPILILLTGCIGFFASYMTTRSRKKEFAVSRCLGVTQRRVFFLVLLEQVVLAVLGGMVGVGTGFWIEQQLSGRALARSGLVVAAFLLGVSIATIRVTSINVMKLMKVED